MKTTSIVARYLLGLMFTVFGLNGFLNFIHQPPPANPLAMQFFVAVSVSHFAAFVIDGGTKVSIVKSCNLVYQNIGVCKLQMFTNQPLGR